MPTRQETARQKNALKQDLRERCRAGVLVAGTAAPPLRVLAESYGISTNIASQVLQELIAEGLFHTVPRVGTFVGRPQASAGEFMLMLLPDERGFTEEDDLRLIQQGFEERVAELGGVSLVMPLSVALAARESNELPPLVGVFDFAFHEDSPFTWGRDCALPRVGFSGRVENPERTDTVSYDDTDGGRQAARHFLEMGHTRIAFLALHPDNSSVGELVWSREREDGWRAALHSAGHETTKLAFHPRTEPPGDFLAEIAIARELGARILSDRSITAVVAANDYAALGLLEAARAGGLSPSKWPTVVGFDNRTRATGHVVSSLRLPAEFIGRTAADLLNERRLGQWIGAPRHRRVPMRLIARLSSRCDWAARATFALPSPTPTPSPGEATVFNLPLVPTTSGFAAPSLVAKAGH